MLEETLTKRESHYRVDSPRKYKRHENTPSDSSTDDECSRFTSLDKNDVKDNGCCVSTYQHIITVQKEQLTCISNCISGIKCSDRSFSDNSHPPLKEKITFILVAIFNRSVLSSIVVYSIVGSAGVMIYEVYMTILFRLILIACLGLRFSFC